MTTYTQLSRLPQIVPFDPAVRAAWGPLINSAWNAIEQLAAGNGSIDLSGLTSYSVSVANDATDQARQAMLNFVGTPAGACTVTIPPISRVGWVTNSTTTLITLTAGGTVNLSVPVGSALLYTVTGNAITAVPITFSGTAGSANVAGQLIVSHGLAVSGGGASVFGGLGVVGGLVLDSGRLFANADPNTNINTIYATPNVLGRGNAPFNGLRICTSAGVPQLTFTDTATSGGVFAGPVSSPAFTTTSDRRAKTDITDITAEAANAWVRAGRPRTYVMDGRERAGFIAQEDMATGRNMAVFQVFDSDPLYAKSDGYSMPGERLARDYNHDIAYLTKALAAALDRIDALEAASGV